MDKCLFARHELQFSVAMIVGFKRPYYRYCIRHNSGSLFYGRQSFFFNDYWFYILFLSILSCVSASFVRCSSVYFCHYMVVHDCHFVAGP